MPEYAGVIEVWLTADTQKDADEKLEALAAKCKALRDDIVQVETQRAEEQ